ncbi:hypothetical protein [Geoglobus acetivorans]|uniref:Uncharacterized protein n=1 Tax=Geoglobus acetivorans TaxID=565033 RepID=A0A0A7GGM1_GEOAI|nr:hypothetical protein GACE_1048 [Geoglobus acetivorans]
MEEYYARLIVRFLGGILLIFISIFALIINQPLLTAGGIAVGLYLSVTAYREGSKL